MCACEKTCECIYCCMSGMLWFGNELGGSLTCTLRCVLVSRVMLQHTLITTGGRSNSSVLISDAA